MSAVTLSVFQQKLKVALTRYPNCSTTVISKLINVPSDSRRIRPGIDYNSFIQSFPAEDETKVQLAIDDMMAKRVLIQTCSFPSRYAVKVAKTTKTAEGDDLENDPKSFDPTKVTEVKGLLSLMAPSATMSQAQMREVTGKHVVIN